MPVTESQLLSTYAATEFVCEAQLQAAMQECAVELQ